MTGGIVQLVAYGKEDLFLTRDPQITFFKVIYRRHTNFAREEIEQQFTNEPDFGKRNTCIISLEGDLIDGMALKITLPAIQSISSSNVVMNSNSTTYTASGISSNGADSNVSSRDNIATQIAWVRRIGYAMIKYIEVEINGEVIDRHYGEWLHIWSMLTTNNINDDGLNKLIGNVPELTDFTNSKEEYTLYVPLQFWFCRYSGLALPLLCLQYSDVKINLELYELDKCYITSPTHYVKCVADVVNFKPYEYLIQKGPDGIERYGIFSRYDIINQRLYYTTVNSDRFIGVPYDGDPSTLDIATKNSILNTPKSERYVITGISTNFTVKPDLGVKSVTTHGRSYKNIRLKNCVLMVTYVYIEDDERMKFARSKQDYLIEQLYYTPNIPIEGTSPKAKLDIDQPCKLTVWLTQLDYISDFNDRFNYTDSHILKRAYDINQSDPNKVRIYKDVPIGGEVGNSLIDEEAIRLNSQMRLSKRVNEYFEYIQPVQHTKNCLPKGCAMYSYSIFPTDPAPSGTTNMSQIELVELVLKMNYRVNVTQKAKLRSYSLCYNIWRVDNGLSALIFVR